MTAFPLLAVSFIMKIVAVLFVLCCLALILIVLIQKGRGGGLSGAFGGAMASGILGSKTGDFLTWVTIILTGVFLTLAVIMAKFYRQSVGDYGMEQPVRQQMPTTPEQAGPAGGTQAQPGTVEDSNAVGSLGATQTEPPEVPEQALPSGIAETETSDTGVISEVNVPVN
jgi:preprotein translocase subunit SecG